MARSWFFEKRLVLPLAAIAGTGIAASLIATVDQSIELDLWQLASIYTASIVAMVFAASRLLSSIPPAADIARIAE